MTGGSERDPAANVVQTVVNNFGALFRHLFPGVLILGAARIVYPNWFLWIDTGSWSNLAFTGVLALTIGNICFAVNRYVIFQVIDYLLYLCGFKGCPAQSHNGYREAIAAHVTDSLYLPGIAKLADQHIKFRYAAVLFLYMIAEVGFALAWFGHHRCLSLISSTLVGVGGIWQHAITRVIDQRAVERGMKEDPA